LPGYVSIDGHVHAEADWYGGKALVNFWRAVENMTVRPPDRRDRWAVSQAAPYRRMHWPVTSRSTMAAIRAAGSWPIAASTARSGRDRSSNGTPEHEHAWVGRRELEHDVHGRGRRAADDVPSLRTPPCRPSAHPRKAILLVDGSGGWHVFVPALRRDVRGTSWSSGLPKAI
jgi:hypothetical protein